ncbi:MAG TPA: hypothetical protein DD473_14730 [Planctomycetaceae bacterium]|nr:hypothetical protein [Planctomycetaceae bacterium]
MVAGQDFAKLSNWTPHNSSHFQSIPQSIPFLDIVNPEWSLEFFRAGTVASNLQEISFLKLKACLGHSLPGLRRWLGFPTELNPISHCRFNHA